MTPITIAERDADFWTPAGPNAGRLGGSIGGDGVAFSRVRRRMSGGGSIRAGNGSPTIFVAAPPAA